MLDKLVEYIIKEWHVISQAPVAFVACIVLGLTVGWQIARRHFHQQIETLRDRVSLHQDRLASIMSSSELRSVTPKRSTDTDRKIKELTTLIFRGREIVRLASAIVTEEQTKQWGENYLAWLSDALCYILFETPPHTNAKFLDHSNMSGTSYPGVSEAIWSRLHNLNRSLANLTEIIEKANIYLA